MLKVTLLLLLSTLCSVKAKNGANITPLNGKILNYVNSPSTYICNSSHAIWNIDNVNITECNCPVKCGDILFNKTRISAYCNGFSPVLHFKQMNYNDNEHRLRCSHMGTYNFELFVGSKSRKFYYEKTLAPVNNNYTLVCEKEAGDGVFLFSDTKRLGVAYGNNNITNMDHENVVITSTYSKVTVHLKNVSLKDEGKIFGCNRFPGEHQLYLLTLTANAKASLTDRSTTIFGKTLYYENSSSTFRCISSSAIWSINFNIITTCECPGGCKDILFHKTRITAHCIGSSSILHFNQIKLSDHHSMLRCSEEPLHYVKLLVGRRSRNFYYEKLLAPITNNYTLVCEKKMDQDAILYNDIKMIGIIYADNSIKNFDEENYVITSNHSKIILLIKNASKNYHGKIFGCVGEGNNLSLVTLAANQWRFYESHFKAFKDSRNRYVFTCYIISNLPNITYEWYWNGVPISKGLSSSMADWESQGSIVFDMLNENVSGNLTYRIESRPYFTYSETKAINVSFFPKVQLNTTSETIKDQNPVNVSCYVQPPHDYIRYPVFKVNGELVATNTISITEKANISCYAEYNFYRGEIKTLNLSMSIGKKLCPKETSYNLQWPETVEGSSANVTCSGDFSGTASRLCLTNGIWELPNIECVKKSIVDATISLYQIETGIGGDFQGSVESLANATKESLNAEDIDETIKSLDIATRITDKSEEISKKDIKNLVGVFSNLLAKDSKPAWVKLEKKNKITAATIMKQMGDFGKVASKKINETTTISTENVVIELAKVNPFHNISFPIAKANQSKWVQESESNVFIPSDVLTDNFGVNGIVMMNAVLFRNMRELLPKNENTSSSINSFVLAISLQKPLESVTHKILLNFSHLSSEYHESSCNFWDFDINSTNGGYWSTRGCEVVESNSKYTVCGCDHLTNFAILMNPVSHKSREILNIITLVGCSISIIALAVTIIVYVMFWKHVTSTDASKSQSVLLINMCVSLIIAYVIFVAFVEGPREKGVCTAIAALIQYFFLVVFFTMLSEGIDMAIALTLLFSARFQRLPLLLLLSWVAPAVIVVISLGSTMTKGFGNGKFCWLTLENNAIWSFVVPALIIILANIVCVIFIVKALLSTRRMLRENVRERLRTGARAVGILTPLLGFTWLFGVFAVNEDLVVFEYIFTISSSLQGLFIFITYCVLNKQIQKNIYKKKKLRKQFTSKPSQSTSNSKDTKETDLITFRGKSDVEEILGSSKEIMDTNSTHDSSL